MLIFWYRRAQKDKHEKWIEQRLILNSKQLIFHLFCDDLHTLYHRSNINMDDLRGEKQFSITEYEVLLKQVLRQVILR